MQAREIVPDNRTIMEAVVSGACMAVIRSRIKGQKKKQKWLIRSIKAMSKRFYRSAIVSVMHSSILSVIVYLNNIALWTCCKVNSGMDGWNQIRLQVLIFGSPA